MQLQLVTVRQYGGKIVEKVLVRDLGDTLLVTTPEEYKTSKLQKREPITVGFRREYLVEQSVKS